MSKPTLFNDKGPPKHFLEELQDSFLRRFGKMPPWHEPVVYEFTDERAFLHQYYRIREVMYRKTANAQNMGDEDVYDKLSYTLIARRGKLVIGGCRLIIREADENFLLPMESADFKLRDLFPNLPLTTVRHGEISRFAVLDDDDEKMEIMLAISKLIIEKCVSSDLGYVFFKSYLSMSRNWRKIISTHCGQKNVRICTEIKVPENPALPEITWYITEVALPAAETIVHKEAVLVRPIESLVH
jgi:hypothetical protein